MTNKIQKFKKGDRVIVTKFTSNGTNVTKAPANLQNLIDNKTIGVITSQNDENNEIYMYNIQFPERTDGLYETEIDFAKVNNWKNEFEVEK